MTVQDAYRERGFVLAAEVPNHQGHELAVRVNGIDVILHRVGVRLPALGCSVDAFAPRASDSQTLVADIGEAWLAFVRRTVVAGMKRAGNG
jgi:hypothetical protein